MSGLRFRMTDSWKKGNQYIAEFRIVKDDGTWGGFEPTYIFFEIEKEPYSIYYSARFYALVHDKKKILTWKETADKLGVSMDELTKITEDAEEYMRDQGIVPHEGEEDFEESRLRKGHLVKESHRPLRKQTIKESRLSHRFTKLLKESSNYGDYENYSYICVEVENEDGRYEAEWKEGDILNPDDVVKIMKDAETINGTAEIETLNTDSPTYGDGCSCIVITLSTADNDEEEEREVCKYWLMPRVDSPEVIDGIADSIENASED